MKEFVSIDTKGMKKSTRIAAIIAAFFFIVLGIVRLSISAGVIGLVLLAAMLLNKKTSVTEEGVVVTYDVVVYQYREVWPWNEIKEIHKELSADCTQYGLHFMKDIMTKRLVFPIEVGKQVLEFAKEMNPDVHIGNVNE